MKSRILGWIVIFVMGLATGAHADPMQDVCEARARKESGSSGSDISVQEGRTTLRLSGSAAVGVSHSSGPDAPNAGRHVPGFAGAAQEERREQQAAQKYQRIYADCMQAG